MCGANQHPPLNYEIVKKIFSEQGCELLEKEYINTQTKMEYRCVCGNVSKIQLNNFKNGQRCGCKRKGCNRLNIDDIKKEVEGKDNIFISCEFIKNEYKIHSICSCGADRHCTLGSLRKSEFCNNCKREKLAFSYEFVKNFFAEKGCKLLETEYKDISTKMNYECECGNCSLITFDSFKQGTRCRECFKKRNSEKRKGVKNPWGGNTQRLSNQFVKDFFKSYGCTLLSEYVNCSTKMNYICRCGLYSTSTWNRFKKSCGCKICGIKKRSGSNNYQWIGDRDFQKSWKSFRLRCLTALNGMKSGGEDSIFGEEFLGYTRKDFWDRMTSHPNWEICKRKDWQIDHIFPFKAFKDYKIYDAILINGLDNIRPLLRKDNIIKTGKYDKQEFLDWLKLKGVKLGEQENSS